MLEFASIVINNTVINKEERMQTAREGLVYRQKVGRLKAVDLKAADRKP